VSWCVNSNRLAVLPFRLAVASSKSTQTPRGPERSSASSFANHTGSHDVDPACGGGLGILSCDTKVQKKAKAAHWSALPWESWGVRTVGAESESWMASLGTSGPIIYLTADSPNELERVEPGSVLVLGGVCDHHVKPRAALNRAEASGVRTTARLPLDRYMRLGKDAHLPLLACAQLLLLVRETDGDWGAACEACPAMRCAPLRKYVRWLPPREYLNDIDAARPACLTETRAALRLRSSEQIGPAPLASATIPPPQIVFDVENEDKA